MIDFLDFYKGKRVLLTGHTGFKGTWMTMVLTMAGADVIGYSRCSEKDPSLFDMSGMQNKIVHRKGDIRDYESLKKVFDDYKPEIVIHMAAQPLVRESYAQPRYTYETNAMGTVNVLECARSCDSIESILNVTTDKVYKNNEWAWGYRENEPLDGYDPYSNSKSCSEIITHSYNDCFLKPAGIAVSTARAGNVIGGGDFAKDRIIPDCVKAAESCETIKVRNPYSVRPYQHVLEPVFAYLMIAARQAENPDLAGWYNIGPDECDCVTTGQLADMFCAAWGETANWAPEAQTNQPHEANLLKLDCSKIKAVLGWQQTWHIQKAIEEVCTWSKVRQKSGDIPKEMEREIKEFREDLQY